MGVEVGMIERNPLGGEVKQEEGKELRNQEGPQPMLEDKDPHDLVGSKDKVVGPHR